jgi:hypothetical protein
MPAGGPRRTARASAGDRGIRRLHSIEAAHANHPVSIPLTDVHPRSRGAMRPRCMIRSPHKIEGAGNAGCPMHPQPRVRNKMKHTSVVTTGSPSWPGILRAMVLRLIPCSPRRANSCCHRHQRIKAHQTRSSLISPPPAWHQQRVSEPHGFAVRSSADHLAR